MIAGDTTLDFQEQRILALEHHCKLLLGQESNGTNGSVLANRDATKEQATKLLELTARLFPPGILEVTRERDPEDHDSQYLVVEVVTSGEFQDIRRRRHQWHDAVASLLGEESTWINLIAYPQ